MYPVWEAIEESGLPVAHHIGEAPLASPCRDNGVLVGMVHNVAPFREMFGRYIFGGILDRNPGLKVGRFEGGIKWVPAALQDAEHMYESMQPLADLKIAHAVAHHCPTQLTASYMAHPPAREIIDPLAPHRVLWWWRSDA